MQLMIVLLKFIPGVRKDFKNIELVRTVQCYDCDFQILRIYHSTPAFSLTLWCFLNKFFGHKKLLSFLRSLIHPASKFYHFVAKSLGKCHFAFGWDDFGLFRGFRNLTCGAMLSQTRKEDFYKKMSVSGPKGRRCTLYHFPYSTFQEGL